MNNKLLVLIGAFLIISISNSQAGIAGVITYLKGECNEPDEKGVQLCSSRETGKIYYVYKGKRFNAYPHEEVEK